MKIGLMMNHRPSEGQSPGDEIDLEDHVLDILKSVRSIDAPWNERVEAVKACLHDTPSDMIRNYAALALVDLLSSDAAVDIIGVLRKRDIAGRSGTLLFALNEIEAALPLDVLARTALAGSYEARNEAMFALEQNRVASFDHELEDRTVKALTPLLTSGDAAAAELASSLLAHIAGRKNDDLRL